jgi:hypothetical protein
MRWVGHIARNEGEGEYTGYWWESHKEKPRGRWVDNIKMDLREMGWDSIDRIDLAQNRDQRRDLVNTVMNLLVP